MSRFLRASILRIFVGFRHGQVQERAHRIKRFGFGILMFRSSGFRVFRVSRLRACAKMTVRELKLRYHEYVRDAKWKLGFPHNGNIINLVQVGSRESPEA